MNFRLKIFVVFALAIVVAGTVLITMFARPTNANVLTPMVDPPSRFEMVAWSTPAVLPPTGSGSEYGPNHGVYRLDRISGEMISIDTLGNAKVILEAERK